MKNLAISNEVELILKSGRIEGNNYFLPTQQLDRKLYTEVNKVLEGSGGKWNRKLKCHVFPTEPQKLIFAIENGAVEIEKIVTKKKTLQQFYTPFDLAEYVVKLADVKGKIVLEPSAGIGNLAKECRRQGALEVHCVELDEECYAELKKQDFICDNCDFLLLTPKVFPPIDRVLTNPPFSKNQDCKHVAHAFEFLKPGGKLVAIMANNQTRKPFVELLKNKQYEIEELKAGRFKESGTNVCTLILTLYK